MYKEEKYKLIAVKEKDMDLIFEWVNDNDCRKNSFKSEMIDYNEHKKWFMNKLLDNNCKMYLYIYNNEYIGQVRIDIKEFIGLIDYSVKKEYRGYGHGTKILILLENKIRRQEDFIIRYLAGEVKVDNLASQKVFEKLGYLPERTDGYILYKKLLTKEE